MLYLSVIGIACSLTIIIHFIWIFIEQKKGRIFAIRFDKETARRIADFAEDNQISIDDLFLRAIEHEMAEYHLYK